MITSNGKGNPIKTSERQMKILQNHTTEVTWSTVQKTILSIYRRPENMLFPKKSRWNMIFLVLSEKIIFLFPENMILHFKRKIKDDFSQKNIRKYDISFKLYEKMVFSKMAMLGRDISYIMWKESIFFARNMIFFFLLQKVRDGISQEIHGNMTFSVYTYGPYKRGATLLCQIKNQRWCYHTKKQLKMIDVLD